MVIYIHTKPNKVKIFDNVRRKFALFILGMVRILGPEELNRCDFWVGLAFTGTELASPVGQISVDAKLFVQKRNML